MEKTDPDDTGIVLYTVVDHNGGLVFISQCVGLWGTALMQLQSLLAPEMLRIMLFRNAEGRGLL